MNCQLPQIGDEPKLSDEMIYKSAKISQDASCPLCLSQGARLFYQEADKCYFKCSSCQLRFLSQESFLSSQQEYGHYLTHENKCDDAGYRKFLSKLVEPLLEKLPPESKGLDFGCGPGPALGQMMEENGHDMSLYDPFFHPDESIFSKNFDFITCTETVEHFHHPSVEFHRIAQILKPGGWLAVMTCFQTDDDRFAGWQYRQDPTHVAFYKEDTFFWLASCLNMTCEIPRKDVVLMQKREEV